MRKALWTVYWRGTAPVRERIEGLLEPDAAPTAARGKKAVREPRAVLAEVREVVALARAGAYLGRDRRVSPKERTRWRFTFRRLATEAVESLRAEDRDDVDLAGEAVAALVDLACETKGYDLFRSEEPIEAARFVVSDAVAALWTRRRDVHGMSEFLPEATDQLVRWEQEYGWTRGGYGWVSERETSLAQVLTRLLVTSESWGAAADCYLDSLDAAPGTGRSRRDLASNLLEWHLALLRRLVGGEYDKLLDRLAAHPALTGPDATFLRAHVALERGDEEEALSLVRKCLSVLPGHRDYRAFAEDLA